MTLSPTAVDPLEITVSEYLAGGRGASVQVIDVREQDEWAAGHLAEARLMPLDELEQRRDELDPAAAVVIVCRSGRRSLVAAEYLRQLGYAHARSLAGGMIAWAAAGQPIAR